MFFSGILVYGLSCKKEPIIQEKLPGNYEEMFAALKLQFNVTYNYVETINNYATGNRGTVRFILLDTSMVETYNSFVTKDRFRLDSLKAYSAKFENFGKNKYSVNTSVFINNAWQNISHVNDTSMVSFGITTNGSYYFYKYALFR